MSDNLMKFSEAVSANREWLKEVNTMAMKKDIAGIRDFAKKAGFDISEEEIKEAVDSALLDDKDISSVAGGYVPLEPIKYLCTTGHFGPEYDPHS